MAEAGKVLHTRYKTVSLLGQGGMGGVYLATDQKQRVRVAIKELELPVKPDEYRLAVQQFTQEASILRQLRHPQIPQVMDFFDEDGKMYLVMEYIQGQTYDKVCQFTPLYEPRLLALAQDLCDVLDYLHTHDPPIIFRDLKPSNIMVTADGTNKLIDFGIAKAFDTKTGGGTHTSVRGAGTPGFAAPEQYGTGTDARTDIYALGVTLYSLLTRTIPPTSLDIASGGAVVVPLSSLRPEISAGTVQAIEKMMRVNRKERPSTVKEVIQSFNFPPRVALPPPAPRPRRPVPTMALVGAALVVVLLVGWGIHQHADPPQPAMSASEFTGDGTVEKGKRIGNVSLADDATAVESRLHLQLLPQPNRKGRDRYQTPRDVARFGLTVTVDGARIYRIACSGFDRTGSVTLKTEEGVALGAANAHATIEKAYGPIEKSQSFPGARTLLEYGRLGLAFMVDKDDRIINVEVFQPTK